MYQILNSKYDSERARRDLKYGHSGKSFGLANPQQLLLQDSDFESLENYQESIRFQIQNMILKELEEIFNMDIAASLLVWPIQRNYCCKIQTLRH